VVIGSSEKHLHRIYDVLKLRLRSQPLIHGDETTVQVLKEGTGRPPTHRIYGPTGAARTVNSRSCCSTVSLAAARYTQQAFLGEYRSILTSDGYTCKRAGRLHSPLPPANSVPVRNTLKVWLDEIAPRSCLTARRHSLLYPKPMGLSDAPHRGRQDADGQQPSGARHRGFCHWPVGCSAIHSKEQGPA
jgi:hypothetical protein